MTCRYRAIYAYAWDLVDQPVTATIAEFKSYGLNTLTMATSYHAGKFIRPRSSNGKVRFLEDGTVYFNPTLSRYGTLQPQANSMLGDRDILAEFCNSNAIDVNGWTVLLHNSRLGALHPEATVCNAFGDRSVYSLCPVNPDVQAYAIALCKDLTDHYPLSGLSLETPGFLPFVHGYHHEFAQIEQNDWINTTLALCFCQHCKTAVANDLGIDVIGLQQRLAMRLQAYLDSSVTVSADMASQWLLADMVSDSELAAFLRWRCQQVTNLVKAIRSELRPDLTLAVIPTVQRPSCSAWLEGTDYAGLAKTADVLDVPFYENNPERIAADAWDIQQRAGRGSKLRGILRPGPPDMSSQEQLTASIAALRGLGIADIAFYNYGLLRQHNLDWIANALTG